MGNSPDMEQATAETEVFARDPAGRHDEKA
jgi:hypothetical protein